MPTDNLTVPPPPGYEAAQRSPSAAASSPELSTSGFLQSAAPGLLYRAKIDRSHPQLGFVDYIQNLIVQG